MSDFKERRRKIMDATYASLKAIEPQVFDHCVALGVIVRDQIDQGKDSLEVAAEAERQAVMLAADILGLRLAPHVRECQREGDGQ